MKENNIIDLGQFGWINKADFDNFQKFKEKKQNEYYLFSKYPELLEIRRERRKNNEDNTYYAYILVGNTRKLAFVDKFTNKAFKCDGYAKTNIEIKKYKFIKWTNSMEL